MRKIKKMMVRWFVFIGCLLQDITSFASTPYKTFTVDSYGDYVETQTAYTPLGAITKVGDLEFSKASDIVISKNNKLYICDTGNKRVIVSDLKGNLENIVGQDVLGAPLGIYVTEDEQLYVADEQKEKVFVFDAQGKLIEEYGKPTHPLFGQENSYKPQKVVVDKRGNIYVL